MTPVFPAETGGLDTAAARRSPPHRVDAGPEVSARRSPPSEWFVHPCARLQPHRMTKVAVRDSSRGIEGIWPESSRRRGLVQSPGGPWMSARRRKEVFQIADYSEPGRGQDRGKRRPARA